MNELLARIRSRKPEEIFDRAIVHLLRTRPYISNVLLQFRRKEVKSGTMGVSFQEGRPVLLYNLAFLQLIDALGVKTTGNICLHEALHIVLLHPTLTRFENHIAANRAMDAVVNNLVLLENKYARQTILPCPLCNVPGTNKTLEQYIKTSLPRPTTAVNNHISQVLSLFDDPANRGHCPICCLGDLSVTLHSICRPPACNVEETLSDEYLDDLYALFNSGKYSISADPRELVLKAYPPNEAQFLIEALFTPPDLNEFGDPGDLSEEGRAEFEYRLRESGKHLYGVDHGGILDKIASRLNKSKEVRWDRYLVNRVCQSVETQQRPDRLTRDRRFGFQFPGKRKHQKIAVAIALDTSGSMSDKLLTEIKNNILALEGNIEIECTVLEFDTEVTRTYDLKKMDSYCKGRGGTDLNIPVKWMVNNKQPTGSLLFVFTDGCGPIEANIPGSEKYVIHWMLDSGGTDNYITEFKHPKSYINKFKY